MGGCVLFIGIMLLLVGNFPLGLIVGIAGWWIIRDDNRRGY